MIGLIGTFPKCNMSCVLCIDMSTQAQTLEFLLWRTHGGMQNGEMVNASLRRLVERTSAIDVNEITVNILIDELCRLRLDLRHLPVLKKLVHVQE